MKVIKVIAIVALVLMVAGLVLGSGCGTQEPIWPMGQGAANDEVAAVETAAIAFYANTNGNWPHDTNTIGSHNSLCDGPGGVAYIDKDAVYNYHFDADGKVVVPDNTALPGDAGVKWDVASHKWR